MPVRDERVSWDAMSKRKLEATRANQLRKSGARVPPGSHLPKRNRDRRLKYGLYAFGLAGFVGLAIAIFLVTTSGSSAGAPKTNFDWATLPGLQTDDPPWTQGLDQWGPRLDQLGFKQLPAETLNFHIHQHLDIWVDGKKQPVAQYVGINQIANPPAITTLHTHDSTGVIHVEAPSQRDYTLGQFFGIWGVKLTPDCIGRFCNTGDKKLRAYVDGKLIADPFSLVLKPHQEIVLTYGTKAQEPNPIPASYNFPAGL
jgi:hypothetical protein